MTIRARPSFGRRNQNISSKQEQTTPYELVALFFSHQSIQERLACERVQMGVNVNINGVDKLATLLNKDFRKRHCKLLRRSPLALDLTPCPYTAIARARILAAICSAILPSLAVANPSAMSAQVRRSSAMARSINAAICRTAAANSGLRCRCCLLSSKVIDFPEVYRNVS